MRGAPPRAAWLFAMGAVVLASTTARAESQPPPGSLGEGPRTGALAFDLGQHVVGIGYQRTLAPWVSVQAVGAYYQPWTQNINFLGLSGDEYKGGDLRGGIVRARAFFYPGASAPTGLWLTPYAQAGVGFGLRGSERKAGPVAAVGASVGYTGFVSERVLLGGGLGVQYHYAKIPGGDGPPSFSRFYPQVEIHVAYAF